MVKSIDWVLIVLVLGIFIFGLVAVTSATSYKPDYEAPNFFSFLGTLDYGVAMLQIIFFGIGVVAIYVLLLVDYERLREFSTLMMIVIVGLLLAVLLFGSTQRGTTGWFMFGERGFQPAEAMKLPMIIILAKDMSMFSEGRDVGISTIRELIPVAWKILIPIVLIALQPDWGSAMVYLFIFAGMLLMARTSWKVLLVLLAVAAVVLPLMWFLMDRWQQLRLETFIDPARDPQGAGFQVMRAKTVAGAGGMAGKGFFSPELLTMNTGFLPEHHTDFIFATITESIGFTGSLVLIVAYGLIITRIVMLSFRAKDDFGRFIILGVAFMFLFHIFENIGMNIGLMPVTGIPLPFISYGGSNMITNLAAIGLVLTVYMRRARSSL